MSFAADIAKFGLVRKAALLRSMAHTLSRISFFGDSITASNVFQDPTYKVFQLGSGYCEQAVWQSGMNFTVVSNTGIGGNTTSQMLARIQTDLLAYKPQLCIFMAGTNDMIGNGSSDLVLCMNNVEKMVQIMLANNILPVLVSPPVKNIVSVADGTTPIPGGGLETRDATRYYYDLAAFYGLPFVDAHKITCDPVTGLYRTGWSADGVHPQFAAIRAIAAQVATVLKNLNSYTPQVYISAYTNNTTIEPQNLIKNGNMCKQTTANLPDNINPNGTARTATTVAALPYTGKIMQLTMAAGGGYCFTADPIPIAGNYAVGDLLEFSGFVQSAGLTEAGNQNGFSVFADFGAFQATPLNAMTCNGTYGFSQQILVPANPGTQIVPTAYAGDAGTYQFGSLTLRNLTKQRAIWQPGQQ